MCSNAIRDQLQVCLRCMHEAVTNERVLSTFELSISGLVSALLSLLEIVRDNDAHCDVAVAFRKVFKAFHLFAVCLSAVADAEKTLRKGDECGTDFNAELVFFL